MLFESNVLKTNGICKNGQRKKWLRGTGRGGENSEKDLLI